MNRKSLNYSLMFSALFLIGLAGIFSYAYIGYKAEINNTDTLNAEVLDPENILNISGNMDFSLNIDLENLSIVNATNNESSYIDNTQNITINLSVEPDKYKSAVTCEYEFFYEPEEEYEASPGTEELVELGFEGECTEGCDTETSEAKNKFGPTSISDKTKTEGEQSLYSGSITTKVENGQASQKWSLHYRFYNLDVDQSSVIGKHPSGKIIVKGKNCTAKRGS